MDTPRKRRADAWSMPSISLAEANMLRQITKSLGLSQNDYVELQAKHRHLLESLKLGTS